MNANCVWERVSYILQLNKEITDLINLRIKKSVRYITHDSCAISVVPPFNRLWAQVSAVVLA